MPETAALLTKVRRRLSKLRTARPGSDIVDVAASITPLRYDVVVRAQFFDFLAARTGQSHEDLVQEARCEPYFVWFRQIECARFFPELLTSPEQMMTRFSARVLGAMRLLHSFEEHGFDPRWPVTLMSVREGSLADSGAPVMARLHIGDGCHRIALLLRQGRPLEPEMYRIRTTSQPIPDNTALLRRHLDISEAEYVRFLAGAFPTTRNGSASVTGSDGDTEIGADTGPGTTLAALRARVARSGADELRLLDRIVTAQATQASR